jgi:hypothetical protein
MCDCDCHCGKLCYQRDVSFSCLLTTGGILIQTAISPYSMTWTVCYYLLSKREYFRLQYLLSYLTRIPFCMQYMSTVSLLCKYEMLIVSYSLLIVLAV